MMKAHAPFALAALTGALLAQEPNPNARSHPTDVAGLGKVSAEEPISIALRAPGRTLALAVDDARLALPEPIRRILERALLDLLRDLRFRALDPSAWEAVGLDPDGDVTVSIGQPGGWLGFPQRARLVVPTLDADRAEAFITEFLKEPVQIPEGGAASERTAFRRHGSQVLVVDHRGVDDSAGMAEELRRFRDAMAAAPTVSGTAVHRAVAKRLPGAQGGLFFRSAGWRSGAEDEPPKSDADYFVASLLTAIDDARLVTALLVGVDPEPTKLFAPGGDPRPALRRLPLPAATVTLRLADPQAVLEAVVGGGLEFRGDPQAMTAMTTIAPVLTGGTIGLVAYPGVDRSWPAWVAFASTDDHGAATDRLSALVAMIWRRAEVLESPGDTRLWADEDGMALGIRDGAIYFGNAEHQIVAAVRGESKGHEPRIDPNALGSLEASIDELLGHLTPEIPQALLAGRLAGRLEMDGDVLVATLHRTRDDPQLSLPAELIAWFTWLEARERAGSADEPIPSPAHIQCDSDLSDLYAIATRMVIREMRVPSTAELHGGTPAATRDPWGTTYELRPLQGRLRYYLISAGPDREFDTEDDRTFP